MLSKWSHISLDHLHSSLSYLGDGSWDVHYLLFPYLLQDVINSNECTCATHTSTVCMLCMRQVFTIFHNPSYLQCTTMGPLEGWC